MPWRIAAPIAALCAVSATASEIVVPFEGIGGLEDLEGLGIAFSENFVLWDGGGCSVLDDPLCGPVTPPLGVCAGACGGEPGVITLDSTASRFAIWALSGPGPDQLSPGTEISAYNSAGDLLGRHEVIESGLAAQELIIEAPGIASVELFSPVLGSEAWDQMTITFEPSSCAPDIDGSGDVGFADLLSVLGAWGGCERCPQDIDGSGSVDFDDLLLVLSAWGTC